MNVLKKLLFFSNSYLYIYRYYLNIVFNVVIYIYVVKLLFIANYFKFM
jgi:hypothetical protein